MRFSPGGFCLSWEDKVRKTNPYTPGEQPKIDGLIKLNTNECPYPPSPRVTKALEELDPQRFRLYPDMDATVLVKALADYYHVSPKQIYVGVGSDDVLSMSFLTFFTNGKRVLFPDITYSFYNVWAQLYRIPYTEVPLRDDFTIDPENYIPGSDCFAAGDGEPGGIVFPNPNAPTGVEMPLDEIERIVRANSGCVVLVDEAYVDFGAKSALPLLERYDNLLITQTMSKSRAMAGMRIGYAIGNEKLIGYLWDVRNSFNSYTMDMAALAAGTAAAEDGGYFHEITQKIIETREWFKSQLDEMGFKYPDSMTNFVFITHPGIKALDLFAQLRQNKILVRHFDAPRISDYLRVTIGTREQMEIVVKVLGRILADQHIA